MKKISHNVNKSCFNCKHSIGRRYAGFSGSYWEPPEPPECDCDYDEQIERCTEAYDELPQNKETPCFEEYCADTCEHYEPEQITCAHCEKEITADNALYGEALFDVNYVCSEPCRLALETKIENEIKELYGDE